MRFITLLISLVLLMSCGSSGGGGGGASSTSSETPAATPTATSTVASATSASTSSTAAATTTTTTTTTTSTAAITSVAIPKLTTNLVGKKGLSLLSQTSNVQGIAFQDLAIMAYSYRPGESAQNSCPRYSFTGSDWSYWMVTPGDESFKDNIVLPSNGTIGIDPFSCNGVNEPLLSDDFVLQAKEFSIDFFEVYFSVISLMVNNVVYEGGDITSGFTKYPDWLNAQTYANVLPKLPNLNYDTSGMKQSFSVLFARKDWFPTSVSVVLSHQMISPAGAIIDTSIQAPPQGSKLSYAISYSSSTLTTDQQTKILSLVNESQGRSFTILYIVPFDGPEIINLSQVADSIKAKQDAIKAQQDEANAEQAAIKAQQDAAAAANIPTLSPDPTPTTKLALASSETTNTTTDTTATTTTTETTPVTINIGFDFNNILAPTTSLPTSLVINSSNNSPFGLNVNFTVPTPTSN